MQRFILAWNPPWSKFVSLHDKSCLHCFTNHNKNSLQNEVIYMREFLTIQIANWKMKYQWKILTKFVGYMSGYIKIFPENNLTL